MYDPDGTVEACCRWVTEASIARASSTVSGRYEWWQHVQRVCAIIHQGPGNCMRDSVWQAARCPLRSRCHAYSLELQCSDHYRLHCLVLQAQSVLQRCLTVLLTSMAQWLRRWFEAGVSPHRILRFCCQWWHHCREILCIYLIMHPSSRVANEYTSLTALV